MTTTLFLIQFAGIDDDDDDVHLLYAEGFEMQQLEIDLASYHNLFGDSNNEDSDVW